MADNSSQKPAPTAPERRLPEPGTLPKLPESIFIIENRNPDGTRKRMFERWRRRRKS
jgi:hypothetical protein